MEIENNRSLKIFDRDHGKPAKPPSSDETNLENGVSSARKRDYAALEVDRFIWPPLCHALDQTARTIAIPIVEAIQRASLTDKRTVIISSASRRSGRTITAIWLAAACVRADLRVALVDADVTQSSIARLLGIQPLSGWESISSKQQPLGEYLIHSLADRFAVLPCAAIAASAPLKIWPTQWDLGAVLEKLRDHYDTVLVDTPPLTHQGIAIQMLDQCAPFVDAALWLDTGPIDTRWAIQQFQAMGIHSLGLVQRAASAAVAA